MHSDWLNEVIQLSLTNQSVLFQLSVIMQCYNLLMNIGSCLKHISSYYKHSSWLLDPTYLSTQMRF